MKPWQKATAAIALGLILLSAIFIAGTLYGRFEQTNKNRKANAALWHAVICDIEMRVARPQKGDQPLSLDRRREILVYYDRLLVKDVHAAPCGIVVSEVRP